MALHNYTIRGKEKKHMQENNRFNALHSTTTTRLPSFLPEITASGSAAPNSAMQSGDDHRHGTPYY